MANNGIALEAKQRSPRINACPGIFGGRLMQWCYTQRLQTQWGISHLDSFVSIVSRPGLPGLWIDAPYHCYAGPHRYRRLPRLLSLRVRIACLRGRIDRITTTIQHKAQQAWWDCQGWVRDHKPSTLIARRRARKEMDAWWSEIER